MLTLNFAATRNSPLTLLCLGAHSDDIEIGCGGTILRLAAERPKLNVHWVVFGANPQREREARRSAHGFLRQVKNKSIVVKNFRDGFFPFNGAEIKEQFEQLKQEVSPDLIFTHCHQDWHQDHRLMASLTWNTFRDHLILQYEIPKYDGDWGTPNFYVHLDQPTCRRKVAYLLRYFQTQRNKHWFTADTFWAMLRLRGLECNAPHKYAEAFYSRKMAY